ncbi:putative hydrolase [compost metagenome]
MQTEAGRELARYNADFLVSYMAKLCAELKGDYCGIEQEVMQQFSSQKHSS